MSTQNALKFFLFIMSFAFFQHLAFAQSLQERLDSTKKIVEQFKKFDSLRMKVRIEKSNSYKEETYAQIEEGEYVFLPEKALFNGSLFTGKSMDECQSNKANHDSEILSRVITTEHQEFVQSGDINADDVQSLPISSGIYAKDPLYAYYDIDKFIIQPLRELFNKYPELITLLPVDFKEEDGTIVSRYDIRTPNSDKAESFLYLDYPKDVTDSIPVYYAFGEYFKESGKSFYHWIGSIKEDPRSPLGYSDYERKDFSIDISTVKNPQQLFNDASAKSLILDFCRNSILSATV